MRIEINGKVVEKMNLNRWIKKGTYTGKLDAVFTDGTTVKANIITEKLTTVLHPSQHLFETDKGTVALEFFEV